MYDYLNTLKMDNGLCVIFKKFDSYKDQNAYKVVYIGYKDGGVVSNDTYWFPKDVKEDDAIQHIYQEWSR